MRTIPKIRLAQLPGETEHCFASIVAESKHAESMEPQAPVGPQPAPEGGSSSAKPMTFAEPKRDSNAALNKGLLCIKSMTLQLRNY